jgi:hypothetical protein
VQMNVWVVWVDFTARTTGDAVIDGTALGLFAGRGIDNDRYEASARIEFTGTVTPLAVITAEERPALEKQRVVAPPGNLEGIAGPDQTDASGSGFSGWDVSRQKSIRAHTGPALAETGLTDGPDFSKVDYPGFLVEGNDDGGVRFDEDSDPYTAGKGVVGQLIGHDTPAREIGDWLSANQIHPPVADDRLHFRIWFREFARVQIGSQWYLASEYFPWRFALFLSRSSGTWQPEAAEIFDLTNDDLP